MWFLLWSVALDTCSSEYTCVSVYWQSSGETQGEGTGTGWGGAGSQGLALQPQGEEETSANVSTGYPLTTPTRSIRKELEERHCGSQDPGLGVGKLKFWVSSARNFLGAV